MSAFLHTDEQGVVLHVFQVLRADGKPPQPPTDAVLAPDGVQPGDIVVNGDIVQTAAERIAEPLPT